MRALNESMPALCCECGHQRSYRQARNVVSERYSAERCIGDLKCSNCKRVTRHALLRGDVRYRDHAEHFQAVALGYGTPDRFDDAERYAGEYRRMGERNPRLIHRFYVREIDRLPADGSEMPITALCGESVPSTADQFTSGASAAPVQQIRPAVTDFDEYADEDGWEELPCVACLHVSNNNVRQRQRERLTVLMTAALAELLDTDHRHIYDSHLESLIDTFERIAKETKPKN